MSSDAQRRPRTADGEEVHQMLVRVPKSLHEKLRARSFSDDRSKAAIVRDAVTEYLRSKNGSSSHSSAAGEEVHQMLVRLPKTLHSKLRTRAFEEDRKKAELIRDALTEYLK